MFFKGAIFWHHSLVSSESLFQSAAADIAPGRKIFVARCKECLGKGRLDTLSQAVLCVQGLVSRNELRQPVPIRCVIDGAELTSHSRSAV
jgi:hypothetical protein